MNNIRYIPQYGLHSVPSGLPADRFQFDPSKYFKVINIDRPRVDENVNVRIQKEGANLGYSGFGEE